MDETLVEVSRINSSNGSTQDSPAKVALPPEALCLDILIDNAIEPLRQLAALPEGLLSGMPQEAQRLLSKLEMLKADRRRAAMQPELVDVSTQVAHAHHIDPAILRGRRRPDRIAFVRHIAFYLCREVTGESFPTIGAHFNRHHTTVMHGCSVINRRMVKDSTFRDSIAHLRQQIEQRSTNGHPHLQGDAANI